MNVQDSTQREASKIDWLHFDGSTGRAHVAEWQYLEGEHTFSDRCRITLEFTGLVIPGLTGRSGDTSMYEQGANWLQVRWPGTGDFVAGFAIGSGFFDFDPETAQPTTSWHFKQIIQAGLEQISAPLSNASWSTFGDISSEIFTLQVIFDRTSTHPNITVDLRSQNIVLLDNGNYTGAQPTDETMPPTFSFRTGSRMWEELVDGGSMFTPNGAYGHTITKFFCENIA